MPSTGRRGEAGIGSRDEMKTIIVAAALIAIQGRILVTQRREGDDQGLLWEFPGGKVEEGEEPRQALQRELREELSIEGEVGSVFDATFYTYPKHPVLLLAYHCQIKEGIPRPMGCRDLRWVTLREMRELTMPPADERIRRHLLSDQGGFLTPEEG